MPVAALSKAYRNEKSSLTEATVYDVHAILLYADVLSRSNYLTEYGHQLYEILSPLYTTFPSFDHISSTVNSKA
jgi:hypothetical protein